uniref:Uncharacterized protein n=1 Tax=Peronospora matthiolae TaxID=2874970 RepID=A0AAV1TYP9_9STRA
MFLRQSLLFTATLLWNQTESALDNRNKTLAVGLHHSSLPRPNENPLDVQTLSELQESATVNVTNRVDQEDEARFVSSALVGNLRNHAAIFAVNMAVARKLPPALAFSALRVGKGQDNSDEVLCTLIKYASEYEAPKGQERWYTPEKVFSLLVKTRSVDKVLGLFKAAKLQTDVEKLFGLLYQEGFSTLRESMNQEWLASKTKPDVVFRLLGLTKGLLEKQSLNVYHWVLYCQKFRQEYDGKASAVENIAKPLLEAGTVPRLLLFREDFVRANRVHKDLMKLVDMIQDALYEGLIETKKISPVLAYRHLQWYKIQNASQLPKSSSALEDFTSAYESHMASLKKK